VRLLKLLRLEDLLMAFLAVIVLPVIDGWLGGSGSGTARVHRERGDQAHRRSVIRPIGPRCAGDRHSMSRRILPNASGHGGGGAPP